MKAEIEVEEKDCRRFLLSSSTHIAMVFEGKCKADDVSRSFGGFECDEKVCGIDIEVWGRQKQDVAW